MAVAKEVLEWIIIQVNDILSSSGFDYTITVLRQCNAWLLQDLYNSLITPPLRCDPFLSEQHRCQLVVDALERHLSPAIKLSHIQGCCLAAKEEQALIDLLNVFFVLRTSAKNTITSQRASG